VLESIFAFLFKYRPLVFESGELAFRGRAPAVLLVLGVLAAAAAVWTYRMMPARVRVADRAVLIALRVAAVGVLLFCLMRPTLLVSTVVPQQNWLGILIDDSRSMRIADTGQPRSAVVDAAFGAGSPLVTELAGRFQLRFYRFGAGTERVSDADALAYAEGRTDIGQALDRAREDLSHVPLSGLVLVTDGADNAGGGLSESLLALRAAGVPVYTVGVGRERFERDIELGRVSAPRSALKGATLAVDVVVAQTGYGGRTVPLIVEDGGRVIATQQVALPADGEPAAVRVRFPVEDAGLRRIRFRVPAQPGELVLENNERETTILVEDGTAKILYFEGEPRWEVAFLRRAVADDANLQVVLLQRTADNKYYRLDVDSAEELSGGFPRTREELFGYRGLVLGSVEASHFTVEQMRIIADFVSERGGGLLMLGGRKAFAEGGWAGTPVAEVLPVELDPALRNDTMYFAHVKVQLARGAASHAVTTLAADEAASLERWRTLPELSTFNRVTRLKPGATALLTGTGDRVPAGQVVLAHQRYGRGLSVVLPVQDLWMWRMHHTIPLDDATHSTLWRQLLRWLVSDVPDPVVATLSAEHVEPGERTRITARVVDERFSPVNGARVVARIETPSGGTVEVPLGWTVEHDGEYEGGFTPTEMGLHRVTVETSADGRSRTSRAAYLDVAESRAEYFGAAMRAPLLRRIADETGGRFYTATGLASLPEDVSITGRGVTVQEEKELWDMPALFLLLVGLIGAEWAFRRLRGLP
jgi:uncharacterized membrane protein